MTQVAIHVGGARSGRARHLDRTLAENWGHALLIVPTRSAARQRLDRVLRESGRDGCLDHVVMDFKSFAEEILKREGEPVRKANDLRRRLILEATLARLRDTGTIEGLPDLAAGSGLVSHLLEVITQLKQAALEPHEFRQKIEDADAVSPLDAMTAAAYEAYQAALIDAGLFDVPGLYWRARILAEQQRPNALAEIDLLLFDGFDDFTPSEFRLLEALAPHVERMAFGLAYDLQSDRRDLHERAAATFQRLQHAFNAVTREHEESGCTSLSDFAADNIFWRRRPPKNAGLVDNLRIVPCIDAQHEAETIARRARALIVAGTAPQRIAIVYRNIANAAPWLRAALDEFCVPAHLHHAPPLAAGATAAFLSSVLHACERWERESIAEVLASPLFAPFGTVDPLLLSSASVARRAMLLEGRAEWAQRIDAYARRVDDQDESAIAGAVSAAVAHLVEVVAELPARGEVRTYCEKADALIAGLHVEAAMAAWGGSRGDNERACLAAVRGMLNELAQTSQGEIAREDFSALLDQALRDTPGPLSNTVVGVQCLDAANARHLEFDYVFFGCLNEGAMPQPSATNAIYNEAERKRLHDAGIDLEGRRERAAREMALYHHVLSLPKKELVLSYRLNEGGREASPSPFLVQTIELFKERPEVVEAPPLADSFLPALEAAACAREVRNCAFRKRTVKIDALFPEAAEGARIERERFGGGEFGAHDGVILGDDAKAILAARYDVAHVFSVAQIEAFAECPFQFFVRRALRIDEEDPPEAELGAMLRGSIMHRVLQLFHEHFAGRAAVEIPEDQAEPLLRELIARAFDEQAWKAQAAPEGVLHAERQRMELLLGRYFAWARAKHGDEWKPTRFEAAFGPAKGDGVVESALPAFELPVASGTAKFSGRIDRIDECNGALRLIDYKTGGVPSAGEINAGTSLQLGVYALATEQLFFPGQTCAEAYFVRVGRAEDRHALGGKKFDRAAYDTLVQSQIDRCLTGIRNGVFPPLPQVKTCYGCTTAHICRHEKARIERKLPPALLAGTATCGEDRAEDL